MSEERPIPPFEDLIYEAQDHVATITLDRPHKKNALSLALVNELIVALETARDDPAVGAIVLTGAGDCFCSGGDLSQMKGRKADAGGDGVPWRGGFVELNLAFTEVGKPVIAKIRKYALAGGLGLVCGAHFAIAEDTATFATPEIDRGIFPMMIMATIFRSVPRRAGLELILLGERISAQHAADIGLINEAVPPEELDARVHALAQKLAAKPPTAMKLGLEAFHAQGDMALAEALPFLNGKLLEAIATPDAREGMMAFLQKRKPEWKRG